MPRSRQRRAARSIATHPRTPCPRPAILQPLPRRAVRRPPPQVPRRARRLTSPTSSSPRRTALRVVVHTDRSAGGLGACLGTTWGGKDEPKGKTGFAHLFEHLMFNVLGEPPGRKLRPVREGRRLRHQRHHLVRPHQLLRDRSRPPRWTWRCGWNPTAWATCSARSTRRPWTSSAAWSRTKTPGRQRAYGRSEGHAGGHGARPVPATTAPSVRWKTSTRRRLRTEELVPRLLRRGQYRDRAGRRHRRRHREGKVAKYFGDIPARQTGAAAGQVDRAAQASTRAQIEDRGPGAITRTWNIPGRGDRDLALLDLASDVRRRQEQPPIPAPGLPGQVGRQRVRLRPAVRAGQLQLGGRREAGVDPAKVGPRSTENGGSSPRARPEELARYKATSYAANVRSLERVGGKASRLAELLDLPRQRGWLEARLRLVFSPPPPPTCRPRRSAG